MAETHRMPYLCRSISAKEPYNKVCHMSRPRQYEPYHIHGKYYGAATISKLLKITGLFCRISSLL